MLQRVLAGLMGMKRILALNDEAHLRYREKPVIRLTMLKRGGGKAGRVDPLSLPVEMQTGSSRVCWASARSCVVRRRDRRTAPARWGPILVAGSRRRRSR